MPTPIRVIASANGLPAVKLAYEKIVAGADPLDAVVDGVSLVEDDPEDLTVGYGGLPNAAGVVELDAAVMHGPTHRAGAVAGLRRTRHAARVAKLVMEQTRHVLLAGDGANEFARMQGFPEEDLLTETARNIWRYWVQTNSARDDWVPPPVESLDPAVVKFFHLDDESGPPSQSAYQRSEAIERPTGTIHCAAINRQGDLSCVTTTSGLAFKIPGRVGDSPIIGAGLFVDNDVGTCGSTGRGEENLRNCSSQAAVELMRGGMSPVEAGRAVLERIVKNAREHWLLGKDGKPSFGLKLYLLNKQGDYAGVSLWGPTSFSVADESGARLEPCAFLFDKSQRSH